MHKNLFTRPLSFVVAVAAMASLVATAPLAANAKTAAAPDQRALASAQLSSVYVSISNIERIGAVICGSGSATVYVTSYRTGRTFLNAVPYWMNFGGGSCRSLGDLADGQALPNTTYYVKASSQPTSTACGTATTRCGSVATRSLLRLPYQFGERNKITGDRTTHAGDNRHAIDIQRLVNGGVTSFTVVAARGGKVVKMGWEACTGLVVHLEHNDGTKSEYLHLASIASDLGIGKTVVRGKVLGTAGRPGSSACGTALHLHFALKRISDGKEIAALWEETNYLEANRDDWLTSTNVLQ